MSEETKQTLPGGFVYVGKDWETQNIIMGRLSSGSVHVPEVWVPEYLRSAFRTPEGLVRCYFNAALRGNKPPHKPWAMLKIADPSKKSNLIAFADSFDLKPGVNDWPSKIRAVFGTCALISDDSREDQDGNPRWLLKPMGQGTIQFADKPQRKPSAAPKPSVYPSAAQPAPQPAPVPTAQPAAGNDPWAAPWEQPQAEDDVNW